MSNLHINIKFNNIASISKYMCELFKESDAVHINNVWSVVSGVVF